jgi:pyruvate formate lyase activating enzyme
MTVAEIMDIFEKERVFMEQSGGGVTFSGGEPMLQPEFLEQLLLEAGRRGFHRAVDTAGNVGRSVLQRISGQTDLFLYDLKMIDDQRHRLFTGVSNALILQNLHELSKAGKEIIIRIPLIGGVNDSEEDARATADFLQSLPGSIREIHLLPYHAIAQSKFSKLGRADSFTPFNPPDPEKVNAFLHSLGEAGFNVRTGG